MIENFKLSLSCDLWLHFIQAIQIRIKKFSKHDTDEVYVRGRLASIVPVTSIQEP